MHRPDAPPPSLSLHEYSGHGEGRKQRTLEAPMLHCGGPFASECHSVLAETTLWALGSGCLSLPPAHWVLLGPGPHFPPAPFPPLYSGTDNNSICLVTLLGELIKQ